MKKTFVLLLILLVILTFSNLCSGGFAVNPAELSITMTDEFIDEDTSKQIIVQNNNDFTINISWYLEHPTPASWMRPNKTFIPSLSWIDLEPKWNTVTPGDIASFHIYLNIPENEDNLGKHWETWVTFKQESNNGIFNQEYAVRLYIDTPSKSAFTNDYDMFSITIGDQIKITLLDLAFLVVIITILLIASMFVYKKKKD